MSEKESHEFLGKVVFPELTTKVEVEDKNGEIIELEKETERMKKTRNNKIEKVMELIETGSGTDIKGVKGTAYGMWNAITEYSDHHTSVRATKAQSAKERKFEKIMIGDGAAFKSNAFDSLMDLVAA